MGSSSGGRASGGGGYGLAEAVVVVGLLAVAVTVALPSLARLREEGRVRAAASYMAGRFRLMREQAVTTGLGRGLWFSRDEESWAWRVVEDTNGNGVRSEDLRRGRDRVISGPHRIGARIAGVRLGIPEGGPFPRIPPARGVIRNEEDPVQFGRSNIVGFAPLGSASSGTLYLTDDRRSFYGIVVFGPTLRMRIRRFDFAERRWKP